MTEHETRRDVLLRKMHAAEDAVQDLCAAIYGVDDRSVPYLIGSGTLIDVGARTFLVTAAHVLDANSRTTLYLPGNPIVPIRGRGVKTQAPIASRDNDTIDLAVVALEPGIVERVIQTGRISPSQLDVNYEVEPMTSYVFVGYPASQNKVRPGRTLRLSSSSIGVLPVAPDRYAAVGANPMLHFAGDFARDEVINRQGTRITAPDPHGMSGGGVWCLGRYADIEFGRSSPVLIGVGIEFHARNRLLLGVRTSFVVASLRTCFPETGADLPPLPPNISINVVVSSAG